MSEPIVFQRKLMKQLVDWKNGKGKKNAVLLEGARRVGKSTLAVEFAKQYYSDYVLIDFTYQSDYVLSLFNSLYPLDRFFSLLFLALGRNAPKPGSLIIFDEIQFCPKARQAIKALVADGRYDYIETGSLISIRENVKDILIPSEESRLEMHPMDFEEFFWAIGKKDLADLLQQFLKDNDEVSLQRIHPIAEESLRLYFALGGMPSVISEYLVNNGDFVAAEKEKRNILSLYSENLGKIDKKYNTGCSSVYRYLPEIVHQESFRVPLSRIGLKRQTKRLVNTLEKLEQSKMVNVVYDTKTIDLSLAAGESHSHFKIYPSDIGLAQSLCYHPSDDEIYAHYQKLIQGELRSNFGYLFESLCEQMLVASSFEPFYTTFTKKAADGKEKRYEIDFLFSRYGKVQPLECKAWAIGKTPSLSAFETKYAAVSRPGIVVTNKPYQKNNGRIYIPFYLLFCFFQKRQ